MASDVVANTDFELADPNMSSDEYMILMSIGKNKGFKIQKEVDQRNNIHQLDYEARVESGNERIAGRFGVSKAYERRAALDEAKKRSKEEALRERAQRGAEESSSSSGEGVFLPGGRGVAKGGFAVAALIPFIPLMGTAITGLVSIITSAINKRKGKGVLPPNLRFGRGSLPLSLGRALAKQPRKTRFNQIDEALSKLKGVEFWRMFVKESKKELADVLPEITNVSESRADDMAAMAVDKAIPPSFQKQLARTTGKGPSSGPNESQMASIVRPLAKWMISEVVDGVEDSPEIDSAISDELDPLNTKLGGKISERTKEGAKKFFRTVLKYGKRITHAVLPKLVEMSKEELPEIIDAVAKKVRLPEQYKEPMAKLAKQHGPKLVDKIGDKLLATTADTAEGSGKYSSRGIKVGGKKKVFQVKVL